MVRIKGVLALILALSLCASACGRALPPPVPESGGAGAGETSSAAAVSVAPAAGESSSVPSSVSAPEETQPSAPESSEPAPDDQPLPPETPAEQAESSQPEPASQPPAGSRPEEPEPQEQSQSAPPEDAETPEEEPPPPESASDGGEEQSGSDEPSSAAEPTPPPEEEQGDPQGSRWLNISEATILTLINKERVRLGVPPLTMDPDLTAAARVRAAELYRGNYVAHTRPDGSPWETVLQQDVPVEFAVAAENLAWTNHAVGQDVPPFQWFQMWQQSESHYAAMVNDHYTHCGVAVLTGPYFDGEDQSYAVTLFCSY